MTDFKVSSPYQAIHIPHNIENIDNLVSYFLVGALGKANGNIYALPYFDNGSVVTYCSSVDKTQINFSNKIEWGSGYDMVIILDYTKVTE